MKNVFTRLILLFSFLTVFPAYIWASPVSTYRLSGEGPWLLAAFLFWLFVHCLFSMKDKEIHHSHIIILVIVVEFFIKLYSYAQELDPDPLIDYGLVIWAFYLYWIILFRLVTPGLGTHDSKRNDLLLNIPVFIFIMIITFHTKDSGFFRNPYISGPSEREWTLYSVMGVISLYCAYRAISEVGQLTSSYWVKHIIGEEIGLTVLVIISFLVVIPYGIGPRVTPRKRHYYMSRVKSDMRSCANGLEAYFVDHQCYPEYSVGGPHSAFSRYIDHRDIFQNIPTFEMADGRDLYTLTTPVPYLSSIFTDPYSARDAPFAYYTVKDKNGCHGWIIWSPGYDYVYDLDINTVRKYYHPGVTQPSRELLTLFCYDPSNGTLSRGDIFRVKQ